MSADQGYLRFLKQQICLRNETIEEWRKLYEREAKLTRIWMTIAMWSFLAFYLMAFTFTAWRLAR